MLLFHILKEGMKQYLGYFIRNYEKLSFDITRQYNSLMISREQSDFITLKHVKSCLMLVIHLQNAGIRSLLRKSLPRYNEGIQLSNDLKLTKRFCINKRRKIISDAGNSSIKVMNESIFRLLRPQQ
jgi:hypothetical protein